MNRGKTASPSLPLPFSIRRSAASSSSSIILYRGGMSGSGRLSIRIEKISAGTELKAGEAEESSTIRIGLCDGTVDRR